jgi:hypothetical protein
MPLPTPPTRTRREVLAALPSSLFLAPARAATTEDAWPILHQAEAKYRAALAYDVQVTAAGSSEVGEIGSSWGGWFAALAPDRFRAEIPMTSFHHRHPRAAINKWLIVGDGRSVFYYRPTLNEYTEEVYRHSPDSLPRITDGAKLFQRCHEEHFERFRSLATRPQREPRLSGQKTIKVFGRKVSCLQIDARSIETSGGHRWSERLWIGPTSFHIVQSLRGRFHFTGDRQARIFRWTRCQYDWRVLGSEIPLEIFRFIPPEGAKLVEQFTFHGPRYWSEGP